MSEPIKVGDLVQVIRPAMCCGSVKQIGYSFVVEQIAPNGTRCVYCSRPHPGVMIAYGGRLTKGGIRAARLKRIPPLPELEGVDEKETLHA